MHAGNLPGPIMLHSLPDDLMTNWARGPGGLLTLCSGIVWHKIDLGIRVVTINWKAEVIGQLVRPTRPGVCRHSRPIGGQACCEGGSAKWRVTEITN